MFYLGGYELTKGDKTAWLHAKFIMKFVCALMKLNGDNYGMCVFIIILLPAIKTPEPCVLFYSINALQCQHCRSTATCAAALVLNT